MGVLRWVGMRALSPACDWWGGVASHLQSLSSPAFAPGKKEGPDSIVTALGAPENPWGGERIHRGRGWGGKSTRAHSASGQGKKEPCSGDCRAGVWGGWNWARLWDEVAIAGGSGLSLIHLPQAALTCPLVAGTLG